MAARITQLNTARGGINRLRFKAGPSREILYDLLNGHVDASGAAVSRPGTVQAHALPAGTKGLCAFDGGLVVFSHQVTNGMPAGVTSEVLTHPDNAALALLDIHFAGPFLGALYVAAEFADGSVFHYWLQPAKPWQAITSYLEGDVIQPSVPNGLVYRARRLSPAGIAWAPNVARTVGDEVEPTAPNGFEYTVVETIGDSPRSGATEPIWPADQGAQVFEDTGLASPPMPPSTTPPPQTMPDDVIDRYGSGRLVTRLQRL